MASRPWRTKAKQHPVTIHRADGSSQQVSAQAFQKTPYWRSRQWQARRSAVLERDEHRCTVCKRKRGDDDPRLKPAKSGRKRTTVLEVHHLTYERYGHEQLGDLATLCQRCHATEHAWQRRRTVVGHQ